MRILLLGEFSALYKNLQEGLAELGVDAVIASYGDGWKKIPMDINLGGSGSGYVSKIRQKVGPFVHLDQLSGFDAVQYISPFYFYHPLMPNKYLMRLLMGRNKKFFISAAGSDAFYWKFGRQALAYGPHDDHLKYDLRRSNTYLTSNRSINFNNWIADEVDGIIPIMYEYEVSYAGMKKLKRTIPIPMNLKAIEYRDNVIGKKLVVFHGLSRYGFKGTRHVESAFRYLEKKYPNDLELVIAGGLPLDQYLALMRRVNVVVDQMYSYSLGVNGIYAMALGKVVVGGAEPIALKSLGADSTPAINVQPNAESLIDTIELLLEQRANIVEMSFSSRKFVEDYHDYLKVAEKYLQIWRD